MRIMRGTGAALVYCVGDDREKGGGFIFKRLGTRVPCFASSPLVSVGEKKKKKNHTDFEQTFSAELTFHRHLLLKIQGVLLLRIPPRNTRSQFHPVSRSTRFGPPRIAGAASQNALLAYY